MFVFRSSYSLAKEEKTSVGNHDGDISLPQKIPIDISHSISTKVLAPSDILGIKFWLSLTTDDVPPEKIS